MHTYEALLSQAESIKHVRAMQRAITRAGGSVKFAPPTSTGLVLVTLILPAHIRPEDLLPGLPFYPI